MPPGAGTQTRIKTYGVYDKGTYDQIVRCTGEYGRAAVLCADSHLGYSQPIGGAIAYADHISPSGVGFDIGCGNKAVATDLHFDDIKDDIPGLMDQIQKRIAFGMGRSAVSKIEGHPVLDAIREAVVPEQRQMYDLAAGQLGTVGAGNHYVDLFSDEDGYIWVGVHFGSRGFGHKTASGFLAMAQGLKWGEKYKEGGMDAPPTLLPIDSEIGQAYIQAMKLAGEYAYAGRDVVVDEVLDILGVEAPAYEVHNHHNFAWEEIHFGEKVWVVRKGCTPAFPGQQGFVGGSMGDISVILVGTDAPENAEGLYSTVHGAGRAMSRTEAAGKIKKRRKWLCNNRDCEGELAPNRTGGSESPKCPECGSHMRKILTTERKSVGKIDWQATLSDLEAKGIVLRGGAADEAPGAYKRLPEVLEAHGETIKILNILQPIGVCMAGGDVHDPFKD